MEATFVFNWLRDLVPAPTVRPLPGLRRTAVQLLASSITQTIKISPLRLQNLQLTWTGGFTFLKGTLLDAPPITGERLTYLPLSVAVASCGSHGD